MPDRLVKICGHHTFTAHEGEEAFEKAAEIQPDVILLDIGMPKLNGYEVCRKIREQPWGKNIRIVALTGWGQEDDRKQLSRAAIHSRTKRSSPTAGIRPSSSWISRISEWCKSSPFNWPPPGKADQSPLASR